MSWEKHSFLDGVSKHLFTGIPDNMLGCCVEKGEIIYDQDDQGKLPSEDISK